LECYAQSWTPYLQKDIDCLEKVQRTRRATKSVKDLNKRNHEDRLRILGLKIQKKSRQRGDLIEIFKLLTARLNLNQESLFRINEVCEVTP